MGQHAGSSSEAGEMLTMMKGWGRERGWMSIGMVGQAVRKLEDGDAGRRTDAEQTTLVTATAVEMWIVMVMGQGRAGKNVALWAASSLCTIAWLRYRSTLCLCLPAALSLPAQM